MSDFEDKTDYLIETKRLLKNRINSIGGSITSGTTFRDYLVWLDSLYTALSNKNITGLPDSLEGKCEQTGTPTPSSPVPINITTGRQVVSVSDGTTTNDYEINLGKNLFNPNNITSGLFYNTSNGSETSSGVWSQSNFIGVSGGTKISISSNYSVVNNSYEISQFNENKQWLEGTQFSLNTSKTYTLNANAKYIRIGFRSDRDTTDKLQIEKNDQATSYAEYKTPIYLGKIGTYQDYIFRNTQGNPLYDSTLNENEWYIHKEIGRVVLNGSEDWTISNSGTQNWYYSNINSNIDIITDSTTNNSMSNYYQINAVGNSNTNQGMYIVKVSKQIRIRYGTQDTVANFKTWLSSHNVEVYYVLNTPTNTLIEDEELINQLNEIEIFTVISEDFYN